MRLVPTNKTIITNYSLNIIYINKVKWVHHMSPMSPFIIAAKFDEFTDGNQAYYHLASHGRAPAPVQCHQ